VVDGYITLVFSDHYVIFFQLPKSQNEGFFGFYNLCTFFRYYVLTY